MKNNWVITIGREFSSGGAETAHKLSKLLDIPYYDKEIIDEAVKTTQLAEDVVAHHDERPVGYADVGGYQYGGLWYTNDPSLLLPVGMRVADAQFEVIRRTASQGPCVIVGRCADYVLEEQKNVFNVFVRSDMENRVTRCREEFGLTEADARKLIRKTDKIRSNYYRYYTQTEWGDPSHYDLVIDAGRLGTDAAAYLIAAYVRQFDPKT